MNRAVSQAEGALMLDSTHRNIWRKQLRAKELMGDFEYFKDVDLLKLLTFILRPLNHSSCENEGSEFQAVRVKLVCRFILQP